MNKPKIWILDDDRRLCHHLKIHMEHWNYRYLIFNSPRDFLNNIKRDDRGCIILDINTPDMSGLDVQRKLIEKGIKMPIIFFTGYGDVPKCRRALKEGAYDFLEKPFLMEKLKSVIDSALETINLSEDPVFEKLTSREKDVYFLLKDGMINKEIAYKLNISLPTVKLHRKNLMGKLGAASYRELLLYMERQK